MEGGVITEDQLREVIRSLPIKAIWESARQAMHGPVESFTLSIPQWVGWGSAGLLDTIQVTDLLEYFFLQVLMQD